MLTQPGRFGPRVLDPRNVLAEARAEPRRERRPALEPRIGAQPGELALRELPSRRESATTRFGEIADAVEMCPDLAIADGTHRRHGRIEIPALPKRFYLRHESRGDHRVEAPLDPQSELRALLWDQRDAEDRRAALRPARRVVARSAESP